MKKLLLLIVFIFSVVFTNVYAYNSSYNTCKIDKKMSSYDYYLNGEVVKKYNYNSNTRNSLKVCFYTINGKKELLNNGETKVLETKVNNRINYEKILCDNGVKRTIFKWTKTVNMPCNFTVNNSRYVLLDGKTRVITSNYSNGSISQKFKCENGKIRKIAEWSNNQIEKKSCFFSYEGKKYKLDHNGFTTIKTYSNDHLVYKKYVCNNGIIKAYSLWRNYTTELTQNCRFIYRGKYYDLQDNGMKKFVTSVYVNGIKKVYSRTYYCEKGVAKIY